MGIEPNGALTTSHAHRRLPVAWVFASLRRNGRASRADTVYRDRVTRLSI